MRLAAQAKGGFYPTPPRVVDLVAETISVSRARRNDGSVLRALDPCCGAGEALEQLAERLRERTGATIETYGVELHGDRAQEAAGRLDHTLPVDLFQTSIANRAFGVLYLNPPYDYDDETKRMEHRFLVHCTRYLAPDGLLVFVVPRRRLAVSARFLSSNYRWVKCWAFPDPERQAFDQVVLIGYRKPGSLVDTDAARRVREWATGDPLPMTASNLTVFGAPTAPGGEVLFATRTVDPAVSAAEARRSGLWTDAQIVDSLWPERDRRTRPLMPLRRGHLAMLVAAGFLDNLCLEADGSRILVKGRTSKSFVLAETTDKTETYRERLRTTVVALDLNSGEITDIAA